MKESKEKKLKAVKAEKAAATSTAKVKVTKKAPATKEKVTKKAPAAKEKVSFEDIISDLKNRTANFDTGSYKEFLAIQVTLSDLEKVFYVEVKDGALSIEPYDYHDRQANIIMTSGNFLKMINGKLNGVLAFTTGRLKVEGDVGKASELSKLFGK